MMWQVKEMCAKYILESVLYWTEEYHIDGFRFDLMGLLDVDLCDEPMGSEVNWISDTEKERRLFTENLGQQNRQL